MERYYESYFPLWWGQNWVKHSIPLLCFAEEIDLFHKICGLCNKETINVFMYLSAKALSLLKRTFAIAHCHHTGKMIFLLPQRGSKGLHTDNVREKVFFQLRRDSNYDLVVFLGCKLLPIPLSDIRH